MVEAVSTNDEERGLPAELFEPAYDIEMRAAYNEALAETYFSDDLTVAEQCLIDMQPLHAYLHEALDTFKTMIGLAAHLGATEEIPKALEAAEEKYHELYIQHFAIEYLQLCSVQHIRQLRGEGSSEVPIEVPLPSDDTLTQQVLIRIKQEPEFAARLADAIEVLR